MVEHYSHIRMAAKRTALDRIAEPEQVPGSQANVNQNVNQPDVIKPDVLAN